MPQTADQTRVATDRGNGPALLVSVRDAWEAEQAIRGGCDVLDVKEPSRGALGMADPATIAQIARLRDEVRPDLPLSVALGEVGDWEEAPAPDGRSSSQQIASNNQVAPRAAEFIPAVMDQSVEIAQARGPAQFVKIGTAALGGAPDWPDRFEAACELTRRAGEGGLACVGRSGFANTVSGRLAESWCRPPLAETDSPFCSAQPIIVAYADWPVAASPAPTQVIAVARQLGCVGVLIDTFSKSGGGLFEWLSDAELHALRSQAGKAGLLFALAGRLSHHDISRLREIAPDVVGIRSAACREGLREREIEVRAVSAFRAGLQGVLP